MICVPIRASSLVELKKKVGKISDEFNLIEIWVDHLPIKVPAKEILLVVKKQTVIVNKPKREKGNWTGSEQQRVERLIEFIKAGANYVDIGLDTKPNLIKKIISASKKSKTKVIISYHNFSKTPSESALNKLIRKAWRFKPDVVKVATYANSPRDNFVLTRLISVHGSKKHFIALGMGPHGIISRVIGLTLGNHINYIAADSKQKTASGQLSLKQYQTLKDIINFS